MTDCSSCARARRGVEEDVGQRRVLCIAHGRIHQLQDAHDPWRPRSRTPIRARRDSRSACRCGEEHCRGCRQSSRVRGHTVAAPLRSLDTETAVHTSRARDAILENIVISCHSCPRNTMTSSSRLWWYSLVHMSRVRPCAALREGERLLIDDRRARLVRMEGVAAG